jgi:CubicO group peptidase (beta-lactamase class C family)
MLHRQPASIDHVADAGFAELQALSAEHGVAGGVFGVTDGRSHWTRAWGQVATVDGRGEADPDHSYLLTSLTKIATAVQVMSLVQAGSLALDEPIAAAIPAFGDRGKSAVTARHALSHTSGILKGEPDTAERLLPTWAATDHIAAAYAAPATSPPGVRVEYCGSPFWALAELCSIGAGVPYWQHLRSVFAGTSLRYDTSDVSPPGFVLADDPTHLAMGEQVRRVAYPAGGALGTITDVLSLGAAALPADPGDWPSTTAPLSAETLEVMCRPQTVGLPGPREPDHPGPRSERGLGWLLGGPGDRRPDDLLFHTGASGTGLWVDRRRGLAAAFLTARWFLPHGFYERVADAMFGLEA